MNQQDKSLYPVSISKVRAVQQGDTFGIFAPGSPLDPAAHAAGVAQLAELGFSTRIPTDPSVRFQRLDLGFGSDAIDVRVDAFRDLIADDEVASLVASRGGYGTMHLMPWIDFSEIAAAGKAVIGYSDLTPLLLNIVTRSRLAAIHGPAISKGFSEYSRHADSQMSVTALLRLLSDESYRMTYEGTVLRSGEAEGVLLAANLSLLQTMLGTPYDIDYDGSILILEDVSEAPYRIHRILHQLALAGKFDRVKAIAFGEFDNCVSTNTPDIDFVFDDFVNSLTAEFSYPVLKGLPIGHGSLNMPVPLGCRAKVDGGTITLLESPLRSTMVG